MSTGLTATTSVSETARLISSRSAVIGLAGPEQVPDPGASGSDSLIATSSRPWLMT